MLDCVGVRFVRKKPNLQNGQKSRESRTNMDIISSFLAKPVDKHCITLVHITYPPLMDEADRLTQSRAPCVIGRSNFSNLQ